MKDFTTTPEQLALKQALLHIEELITTLIRVEELLNHLKKDEGGDKIPQFKAKIVNTNTTNIKLNYKEEKEKD